MHRYWLAVLALSLCGRIAPAQATVSTATPLAKKVIEYGWDVPSPDYVRAHIREMEQRALDGIIFRLQGGGNVLEPAAWDEGKFAADFENVQQIAWEKFTDNFLILWAASEQDWFDDAQWQAIEHNVGIMGKAARLAKCVGICFDAEPYGKNPWAYSEAAHRAEKSFGEYETMARQRGRQFMQALEKEFPHPQILTFYQLGLFQEFCRPMAAEERAATLSQHGYALYPAFFNGMLEAASAETGFHDGNENAYYYREAQPYFEAYHRITQRALHLVDPALREKYRAQVRVGQALYIDQYFGLRSMKVLGDYLTPQEQPQWFEHNVYWALYTADQYVWCYSERMNWWTNTDVPAGAEEALVSARRKIAEGAGLGLNIKPFIDAGGQREEGKSAP
ncbi:MAG: hypothetical protein HYV26_03780 [Candidatus Hydrogenedentes bacterium]|nr:hypothetical protein [Candidatus Hydrogenedentota bacterium]MBI3117279.1 hypothetical protein [Candidatus Hydrogenedentota bacterium]